MLKAWPSFNELAKRFAEGEVWDIHVMALLRDEWLALDRPRSWDGIPSQARAT